MWLCSGLISCEPCCRKQPPSNSAIKLRNNLKGSQTEESNNYGFAVNSKELEAQLESAEKEWKEYRRSYKPLIQLEVTSITIAEVLSSRTGIPVTKLQASQMQQLLQLDIELHKRVIGQDEACNAIARAIQRSRAGLSDPKRPIASLMFMGPTGVRFSSWNGYANVPKSYDNRFSFLVCCYYKMLDSFSGEVKEPCWIECIDRYWFVCQRMHRRWARQNWRRHWRPISLTLRMPWCG